MKRLAEEVSLAGIVDSISMMQFRRTPGEIIRAVELGKTFVITRSGKEIAVLSKPPGEVLTMNVAPDGKVSYLQQSSTVSKDSHLEFSK